MRQIFSVRFFAAVGGVLALLFLLTTIFATRSAIDDEEAGGDPAAAAILRPVDLVERIQAAQPERVLFDAEGYTTRRTVLTIDDSRAVTITPGTPGEVHCRRLDRPGRCGVVLDLLGEAVVWFAIVPMGGSRTSVDLPAIDTLDEGVATLVNGWQFRFAPALDRRCGDDGDEEFSSYRELRDELGDDFTAVFDIPEQRLVAVVCRERVPYAPAPSTLPGATSLPAGGTTTNGPSPTTEREPTIGV